MKVNSEFLRSLGQQIRDSRFEKWTVQANSTDADKFIAVAEELDALRGFYHAVAKLTIEHDAIGDAAVVSPAKLADELAKINTNWWRFS